MPIKTKYLSGGVSVDGGVGIRDRRMLLGLGLSSIVNVLKVLNFDRHFQRTLGSEISKGQDKWSLIFTIQVFHFDRAELDKLSVLGGAEDEFLGSGGAKGFCARYWQQR